jgi:hypothetical protein
MPGSLARVLDFTAYKFFGLAEHEDHSPILNKHCRVIVDQGTKISSTIWFSV